MRVFFNPTLRIAALSLAGLAVSVGTAGAREVYVCNVLSDCAGEADCDPNPRVYVLDPGRNTVETGGFAYRLDYFGNDDDAVVASASPDRGDIELRIDSDLDAVIQDEETYEGRCKMGQR